MIPKFNPGSMSNPDAKSVEYSLPTKVENDEELQNYFDYLKSIGQGEGMGSITESDLAIFYRLFQIPQRFSKEKVEDLFALLEQLAGAERFESNAVARECVLMIDTYRTELDL